MKLKNVFAALNVTERCRVLRVGREYDIMKQ